MAETLVLRTGCDRWLRYSHGVASLAAVVAMMAADAGTGWTAAAVAALVLTHGVCARRMADSRMRGRLHLSVGGDAVLFASGGVQALKQQAGGWHSRMLCVLPLVDPESGHRRRFMLCRSLNRPDTWRRLLVQLRLGGRDPS